MLSHSHDDYRSPHDQYTGIQEIQLLVNERKVNKRLSALPSGKPTLFDQLEKQFLWNDLNMSARIHARVDNLHINAEGLIWSNDDTAWIGTLNDPWNDPWNEQHSIPGPIIWMVIFLISFIFLNSKDDVKLLCSQDRRDRPSAMVNI